MRRLLAASVLPFFTMTLGFSQINQNSPARDPQAISLLQQSVSAMATVIPSDSTETGSVVPGEHEV